MFILKKNNSQNYSLIAERGKASERDKAVQTIIFRHRKKVPGYQFSGKYKSGIWDGAVYNFKPSSIRAGFLQETIEHLNTFQVPWKWENNKSPDFLPFYIDNEFDQNEFSNFCSTYIGSLSKTFKEKVGRELEVRDYQISSAFKALTQKLGIILHSTGSGKSFTISIILAFLFYKKLITKAVIIVPRQSLTTQFKNDLITFGFDESKIGLVLSSQKQTSRPITIIMNQSLRMMEETSIETDFLNLVDFVVCDEVHTAAAKTVTNSIIKFKNSKYFLGFTGTLPESELDRDIINSLFGYVIDEQNVKDLSGDVLAEVTVGILTFNYGTKAKESRKIRSESTRGWNEEVNFLQNDDSFRNKHITNIVYQNYLKGGKIIVLVKNTEYGLKLFKKLSDLGVKNIFWIEGSVSLKERDTIIETCRNSKEEYVIVTNFSIFSVGINIPNIDLVIFADSSKSKITVAQSIGRGIRKTSTKTKVNILDCSCDLKYGAKHGRKRKQLYQDEGFKVVEKIISIDDENNELANKINNLRKI
jgi:superfamily II DNA or RNA helicase